MTSTTNKINAAFTSSFGMTHKLITSHFSPINRPSFWKTKNDHHAFSSCYIGSSPSCRQLQEHSLGDGRREQPRTRTTQANGELWLVPDLCRFGPHWRLLPGTFYKECMQSVLYVGGSVHTTLAFCFFCSHVYFWFLCALNVFHQKHIRPLTMSFWIAVA